MAFNIKASHGGWGKDPAIGNLSVYSNGCRRLDIGTTATTQEGAASTALLFGMGTSTTTSKTATASKNFAAFYTESAATSGDSRGLYWRHYISGVGGDGEAIRAFTTIQNVATSGSTHGIHASLSFGTSGTTSGQGAAGRFTLHIPNSATQAGTLTAVLAEITADGATSDTAGATTVSFFRPVISGDTTGDDTIEDDAVLFDLTGCGAAGAGHVVITDTGNVDTLLSCKGPDGAALYIMCTSTIT